ncbi:hypothetical protein Y1Q_0021229 [Alligator mississippiensis]|uniref:Uncharacterized protein n=1 Tax=Alligator mississippiensis TaxID=8496 RepID=A0A151MS83_ALLMI|nr:hypothetical protein Y1Q_0021229 [Alligator mississippiensis]
MLLFWTEKLASLLKTSTPILEGYFLEKSVWDAWQFPICDVLRVLLSQFPVRALRSQKQRIKKLCEN